jgi:hypothetical protein
MSATPPDRPKGPRPVYFEDPAIDQLHAALLATVTELAVAFDRIDTLERLLESRLGVPRDQIDQFVVDEPTAAARAARHADLAARVLKPFVDYRSAIIERGTGVPPAG